MRKITVRFVAAFALCAAFAPLAASAAAKTPSDVLKDAAALNKTSVTVSGKVKGYAEQSTPKGTFAFYQLCDTQCINVIDSTKPGYKDGATGKITGTFMQHFQGPRRSFDNVVIHQ